MLNTCMDSLFACPSSSFVKILTANVRSVSPVLLTQTRKPSLFSSSTISVSLGKENRTSRTIRIDSYSIKTTTHTQLCNNCYIPTAGHRLVSGSNHSAPLSEEQTLVATLRSPQGMDATLLALVSGHLTS